MFWTFNLSLDILVTVWATFPNIGQIFVQFSGHSENNDLKKFVSRFANANLVMLHLTLTDI
jgi:hypothetical protein